MSDNTFSDDFQRADGGMGSNWVLATTTGWASYYTPVYAFSIESGAAVAPVDVPGAAQMRWNADYPGDQFFEFLFDNAQGNNGFCYPALQANGINANSYVLSVNHYDRSFPWTPPPTEDDELYIAVERHFAGANADLGSVTVPYPATEPALFRFEADASGKQRCYVNGVLVLTTTDPAPITGPHITMFMSPDGHLGAYDSPRILSVSGGNL